MKNLLLNIKGVSCAAINAGIKKYTKNGTIMYYRKN
jgi:hypothetical protein